MINFFSKRIENYPQLEQRMRVLEQSIESLHIELLEIKAKARKKIYQDAFKEDKTENINSPVILPYDGSFK